MAKTKPLSTRALKKRVRELQDEVVIVETATRGKLEGFCEHLRAGVDGEIESLFLATHKADFGGVVTGSGFSVPADEIIDIYVRPYPMHRFPENQQMLYQRAGFVLPDDRDVVAELLCALDDTFYQISAELNPVGGRFVHHTPDYAPVELVISGSEQTSSSHRYYQGIEGWRYRVSGWVSGHGYDAKRSAEAMADVAAGKPLMGLIIDGIDLSPRRDDLRNDVEAQQYLIELLADHVQRGYFGQASFCNHSSYEAHTEGRVEMVLLHLDEWEERQSGDEGFGVHATLPPALELMWDAELGGAPENCEKLLAVVRKYNLEQLPPLLTWRSSWFSGWRSTPTEWRL